MSGMCGDGGKNTRRIEEARSRLSQQQKALPLEQSEFTFLLIKLR